MNTRIITSIFGSCSLSILLASAASAQVQRTFVSGGGSDSNPCSRTAPCRTLSHAASQTASGGEVVVLDSAGYGAFSITHAVSITAPPGVYAGITVFSGDGIGINADGSDTVILRGLTINNQGSNGNGIAFNTGAVLHVDHCVVNGFSLGSGLSFQAGLRLEVKDSIFAANGFGIKVRPPSGRVVATIDHVRIEGNGLDGLQAHDGSVVSVSNSVVSGNTNGFVAVWESGASTVMDIESCVASNNVQTGILVGSNSLTGATVRLSNSTVTGNDVGIDNLNAGAPGTFLSRGNNTVEGNHFNTFGTIGSYAAK